MQVFVDGIEESLEDVLSSHFARSSTKCVSGGARTRRRVLGTANDSQCARGLGIEARGETISQRFGYTLILMEKIGIWWALEFIEYFREVSDSLIAVVSAMEYMAVVCAETAALAVFTGIAENGAPSTDMFVLDLDETDDGSSSAKTGLSRGFAKKTHENAFKEAVGHFVPVD